MLGGFYSEKAVSADATMSVTDCFDGVFIEIDGEVAIIDDYEVVAGTVHFVEME